MKMHAKNSVLLVLGLAILLLGLGCPEEEEVRLVSLSVSADLSTIAAGRTATLVAMGTYSDDTVGSVEAVWSSANEEVALVFADAADASRALFTAEGEGSVEITATAKDGSGVSGAVEMTVTAAVLDRLEVLPTSARVALGMTKTYEAIGTYSDGACLPVEADWTVDDTSVATVDDGGEVTGEGLGTALLTAVSVERDDLSASAGIEVVGAVPVSLAVSPDPAQTPAGLTVDFTAEASFSDGTSGPIPVTWSSSDDAVASVDGSGTATGNEEGAATITATSVDDPSLSGSAGLTVGAPVLVSLDVTPSPASVVITQMVSFTATGVYSDSSTCPEAVTWSSSDTNIATVDLNGSATGVNTGSATITATAVSDPQVSGAATLTVKPPFTSLYLNDANGGSGNILEVPYAGGAGTVMFSSQIHPGSAGMFDPPLWVSSTRGICTKPDGTKLYFLSTYGHIYEYDFASQSTAIVHLNPTLNANKGWQGLTIDPQGHLYMVNMTTPSYGVVKVDLTQNVNANYPGVRSQFCTIGSVSNPFDLAFYQGDIYVAYWGGVARGSAGGALQSFYPNGSAVLSSLAVDAGGTFYAVDTWCKKVYRLEDTDQNGYVLGAEKTDYADFSTAGIFGISELMVDALGDVYVAELSGGTPAPQGIWNLHDGNQDGDALDAGEQTLWSTAVLGSANGGGNMAFQ